MHLKVFFVLCVLGATYAQSSVNVDVYYESLCPDSRKFINTQLYPALQNSLKKSVHLNLIPYGKSKRQTRGSDVEFECHHGPNECYGNKVHACALNHIQVDSFQQRHDRESLILTYINCLMENSNLNPSNVFPTQLCAQRTGVQQYESIVNCANGTEGSSLLAAHGEKTDKLSPPLTSVPTIVFDNQYERSLQTLAETNFVMAVCKKLGAPRPQECPQINSAPITTVATLTGVLMSVAAAVML
uniref:Putative gamma-interferon-inducible lysosomal thiol reductase n=1 Tax=Xenopsylla cheopis TaxID=163159 RepID=A0A6M2E2F4_XENCH